MPELGIGIVGTGFMARVHALSIAMVAHMWELPVVPKLIAYCGRADAVASALPRWPEFADAQPVNGLDGLLDRSDVALCLICTSNAAHASASIAALRAGRHVLCEKPLASNPDDSLQMARYAALATGQAAVGFNYRRVPAVELARQMIIAGDIGIPQHFSGAYLQDWGLIPGAATGWRDDPLDAGPAGILADTGSHLIDLAQHLMGSRVAAVAALAQAPRTTARDCDGLGAPAAASLLLRFIDGNSGNLELSRVASGHRNGLRLEVRGSEGALRFSFERMNELELSAPSRRGETWRCIYVTERDHPWQSARWPPGHPLSWEHTLAHQVSDLIHAIASGTRFRPNFQDGCSVDLTIHAAARAVQTESWQAVDEPMI